MTELVEPPSEVPGGPLPLVETEPAHAFDELEVDAPVVGILAGSSAELARLAEAERELSRHRHRSELRLLSPYREPDKLADYSRGARMRGLRVLIAGAALGGALPGVVAAHTDLPVIGVPLVLPRSVGGGLDALLAIAQSPATAPVACVGVDNARAAGALAVRILAG